MFCKVNTHSFDTVSRENGDEAGVISFHLIGDELEGLAHGVFDHFLFGFFGFFETFVKVLEKLGHESLARTFHVLSFSYDSVLFNVDSGHEKIDHVAEVIEKGTLW